MATIPAARPSARAHPDARRLSVGALLVPLTTALALLGVAVTLVLPPVLLHPLLDAAGSQLLLGVSASEAHRLSDRTVTELVFGPATFAFEGPDGGPMFDAAEISHLRDARTLLWTFLTVAAVCGLAAAALAVRSDRSIAMRWVGHGGVLLMTTVVALGLVAVVAFGPAFEIFHRVFFPGGNWAFSADQRLVQLYPLMFWQSVSALVGAFAVVLGMATWVIARRLADPPTRAAAGD